MPEHILMNRGRIPKKDEKNWISKFELLTNNEKKELLTILCNNRKKNELRNAYNLTHNQRIKRILDFYIIPSEKDESNLSLFEKYG
jgi:hypothetical protein